MFMTEQAASQASREDKNCAKKKPRSLTSIPPTRAALVNHAERAVFQDGFVWPQTPPEGAIVTMSFSGG